MTSNNATNNPDHDRQFGFRALWRDGRISYHPEAENIPRMRPEEFADHVCGMAARGFDPEYPILLTVEGADVLLVDGRHRSEACTMILAAKTPARLAEEIGASKCKVSKDFLEAFGELDEHGNLVRWREDVDFTSGDRWQPVFRQREFADLVDLRDYVYAHNIRRRHLSQSQLAALALPKYFAAVASNAAAGSKGGRPAKPKHDDHQERPQGGLFADAGGEAPETEPETASEAPEQSTGRARTVAAESFGVSEATLTRMVYVKQHGPSALGEEEAAKLIRGIEAGEIEVGTAYNRVKAAVKEAQREEARKAAIAEEEARAQQAAAEPELPGVRSGAWWESEGVQLHNADFFSVAGELESKSIDLIFDDPAYMLGDTGTTVGNGERVSVKKGDWDVFASWADFVAHVQRQLEVFDRLLAHDGALWITGTRWVVAAVVDRVMRGGFNLEIVNDIAWTKPNPPPRIATNGYTDDHEWILLLRRPGVKGDWRWSYAAEKVRCGGKQPRATWSYGTAPASERRFASHPCQKPRAMLRRIMDACRIGPGDRVLECFGGLGPATLEAAAHGAQAIYCELDPDCCEAVKASVMTDRAAGRQTATGKIDDEARATLALEAVPVFVFERRRGVETAGFAGAYEWSGVETIVRPEGARDLAETVLAETGIDRAALMLDVADDATLVYVVDRDVLDSLSKVVNHPDCPAERARLWPLNVHARELAELLAANWPAMREEESLLQDDDGSEGVASAGERDASELPPKVDHDGEPIGVGVRVELVGVLGKSEGRAATIESIGERPYARSETYPVTVRVDGDPDLNHRGSHQVRVLTAERERELAAEVRPEPSSVDEQRDVSRSAAAEESEATETVDGPPPNYTIETCAEMRAAGEKWGGEDWQHVAVCWQGDEAVWISVPCDSELDAIDAAKLHHAGQQGEPEQGQPAEEAQPAGEDPSASEHSITAKQREALAALEGGALAYHGGRWYRSMWRPSRRAKPRTVAEHGPNPDERGFAAKTIAELEAAKLVESSGDRLIVITDAGRDALAKPWAPKRKRRGAAAATAAALLLTLLGACTPVERHTALVTIGAAGCGGGQAAEGAGEEWGAVVAAIGCWLADWSAERLDRIRRAEQLARMESTAAAEAASELARLEVIEASARELQDSQAALLEHPCEEHVEQAKRALERCEALRRQAAI